MKESFRNNPTSIETEQSFSGKPGEVYCQILGKERLPADPSEMPKTVYLPAPVLGNMEEAILDDAERDFRERSEFVLWDPDRKQFRASGISLGSEISPGPSSQLKLFLQGHRRKPILNYHIHREPGEEMAYFSEGDLIATYGFPQGHYIDAAGSREGLVFLLQTKQSEKSPPRPIFLYRLVQLYSALKRVNLQEDYQAAELIKELGYAYYRFWPQSRLIKQGNLLGGIIIRKI